MKNAILSLIVLLAGTQAHALHCTIARESATEPGQYNQLVTGAVEVLKGDAKTQVILVKKTGEVIENFDFSSLKSVEDWNQINKATVAFVNRGEEGLLSIGLSRVNAATPNKLLRISSLAMGKGEFLAVISDLQKLSFSCFQM